MATQAHRLGRLMDARLLRRNFVLHAAVRGRLSELSTVDVVDADADVDATMEYLVASYFKAPL